VGKKIEEHGSKVLMDAFVVKINHHLMNTTKKEVRSILLGGACNNTSPKQLVVNTI
jgi:hypothetical protein